MVKATFEISWKRPDDEEARERTLALFSDCKIRDRLELFRPGIEAAPDTQAARMQNESHGHRDFVHPTRSRSCV